MTSLAVYETEVRRRLEHVVGQVEGALAEAGRAPGSARIVAVSKYVDASHAACLVRAGLTHLGENRLQVAQPKLDSQLPVTWHFIGPLQRNKLRRIVAQFDWIHSLDRHETARDIDRLCMELGREVRCLVQVNVSGEAEKSGLAPGEVQEFVEFCQTLPNLQVVGLMMIGSRGADAGQAREEMGRLRTLRDSVAQAVDAALPELSMGMSGDYLEAIAEGATIVRLGRVLVADEEVFDK
ncbi:MAG: YggS family pyridoxal phosphate-dependent enzyme [Firmicutes bacterium]|nr:YggS family pyridoxal phosphate-dependent enzyme [Bacillota bacterium]